MTRWYVKELSDLTRVSVQTLHYYDRIELLKPSLRLDNGYRLYSEADLLKLQQILALKFFGFNLLRIKTLLADDVNMIEHFAVQSQFLQKKAKIHTEASNTLKNIITNCNTDESVSWKTVIKLMAHHIIQQLEHPELKEIFTPKELQQYTAFKAE